MTPRRQGDGRAVREGLDDRVALPRARFVVAASLVLFTIVGLLRFTYKYFDDIARDESGTFAPRLIEEATGSYTAMLLFMAVVVFAWRFPLDRQGWRRRVPAHLAAMVVYSVAHTTLLYLTRTAIFPLAGLGPYDYGRLPARYLMEFGNDAIGYLTFLAIIAAYRHYQAARQRELRTAQLERTLAQAELRNLRLQLQPHFLFNALNTISSTMYDDPRAADRMIGQLSELLRLSLRTSHTQEVVLREEIDVLSHYVALMRARFGDRLRVEVQMDDDTADALVPSLLLQPLVENAIRHGNVSRRGKGALVVRTWRDGAVLRITVADDGPGAAPGTDLFGTGVGLSATRDRLRLLYGDGHTLDVGNAGDGFVVSIAIPLRTSALARPVAAGAGVRELEPGERAAAGLEATPA